MLKPYELDPALDAVIAASDFHRVLLENDHVRVLEVVIEAGAKEPFHTHRWQSAFTVFGTPHLRYFVPDVPAHQFEIPAQLQTGVLHLAPEGMHALENIDNRRLFAYRIELKNAPAVPEPSGAAGPILEVGVGGEQLCLDNTVLRLCHVRRMDAGTDHFPFLLIRRPLEDASAEWITAKEQWRGVRDDDLILVLKYI